MGLNNLFREIRLEDKNGGHSMWDEFLKVIRCFPRLLDDLNIGCTKEDIERAENIIGVNFPDELRLIYLKNNGQKGTVGGLFKAVSGYDKYSRLKFLSIDSMVSVAASLNNQLQFVVAGLSLKGQATTHVFARDRLRHVCNWKSVYETPRIGRASCADLYRQDLGA